MNNIVNWIDAIAVGFLFVIVIFLSYKNIQLRSRYSLLGNMHMQALADNYLVTQALEKMKQEMDNEKLKESDGFVKFLSTSRDWAFNYIEQVQDALKEFDETITPITIWNETYGTAIEHDIFRQKIIEISSAYERLQSLLPKNEETPNN